MGTWLTYQEVSKKLIIPKGTLAWLVHQKKIPHYRIGPRMVRFSEDELEKWMRDRAVRVEEKSSLEVVE